MRDPETRSSGASQLRLVGPALRALRLPRGRVGALAVLAFLSGIGAAATLVLLINVGLRLTGTDSATAVLGIDLAGMSTSQLFLGALTAAAGVFAVDLLAARQSARIIGTVQHRLRTALFDAYNRADWVTQAADPPGHLQEVMTTNVARALNLTIAVNNGLVAALTLVTMVGVAFVINPLSTGLLIASLAVLVAAMSPLAGRIGSAAERMRAANHAYAVDLAEMTGVATDIRTFGVGAAAEERHRRVTDTVAGAHEKLTWLEKAVPSAQRNLSLITVLAVLALLHGGGVAGPEELGAVVVLLGRSITYVHGIQQTINKFASAGPFLFALEDEIERYADSVSTRPSSATPTRAAHGAGSDAPGSAAVTLEAVRYRHPRAAADALADVSISIEPGTYVALVGPSGSGKTTLAEIVLGLRRPTSGSCRVDDDDPADLDATERARRIAFVPQKPTLIRGTLADNIRFLRCAISDDAVARAAAAAGLTDDAGVPVIGFDAMLGDGGRTLSGGQLQRLAIARALAGEPGLLVLDEPTSALDPDAEAAISDTLARLAGSVTLLVIAHRAATIEGCDRVVVLEGGRVVADATPDEIADRSAFWKRGFETPTTGGRR